MRLIIQICVFVIILMTVSSCYFARPDGLKMIEPAELYSVMKQGDILLIDTHSPEQKHIKDTDYYVPFYRVRKHADKFPKDKNTIKTRQFISIANQVPWVTGRRVH